MFLRRTHLVLALVAALAMPAMASADATFTFTGHGYGHGVGMGQYGAQGYALQGWTHEQILAHYYQGTTLGPTTFTQVRVLLQDGAAAGRRERAGGDHRRRRGRHRDARRPGRRRGRPCARTPTASRCSTPRAPCSRAAGSARSRSPPPTAGP